MKELFVWVVFQFFYNWTGYHLTVDKYTHPSTINLRVDREKSIMETKEKIQRELGVENRGPPI